MELEKAVRGIRKNCMYNKKKLYVELGKAVREITKSYTWN
jgi:hypothetical protein